MKPMIEWEENDLLDLIRIGAEEDISRDWKDARALAKTDGVKNEISKDISAFANSAGGGVVYGLVEDKNPPHGAVALSPIDPAEFPPEWLENVILSRVKPRLQGLRIKSVSLATQHPGKIAYIVYVPSSVTAHQASDKKYYKRYELQSAPMEDYEIRLAMHRTSWPKYEVQLRRQQYDQGNGHQYFGAIATNTSDLVAHDVSFNLLLPVRFAGAERYCAKENVERDGSQPMYWRIPAARNTESTLYPGSPLHLSFDAGYLKLQGPLVVEEMYCEVILRVYDRFGRAHEGIFEVTLFHPLEIRGASKQLDRESLDF